LELPEGLKGSNSPLFLDLKNLGGTTTTGTRGTGGYTNERPHPDSSRYFEDYKLKNRVPFRSKSRNKPSAREIATGRRRNPGIRKKPKNSRSRSRVKRAKISQEKILKKIHPKDLEAHKKAKK
jgi:hypothetical protein